MFCGRLVDLQYILVVWYYNHITYAFWNKSFRTLVYKDQMYSKIGNGRVLTEELYTLRALYSDNAEVNFCMQTGA